MWGWRRFGGEQWSEGGVLGLGGCWGWGRLGAAAGLGTQHGADGGRQWGWGGLQQGERDWGLRSEFGVRCERFGGAQRGLGEKALGMQWCAWEVCFGEVS